jgi:hypothetical protein
MRAIKLHVRNRLRESMKGEQVGPMDVKRVSVGCTNRDSSTHLVQLGMLCTITHTSEVLKVGGVVGRDGPTRRFGRLSYKLDDVVLVYRNIATAQLVG